MEKEVFRVAITQQRGELRLAELSKRCDRVRSIVVDLFTPLNLEHRLSFRFDDALRDRCWLVVNLRSSGQLPLTFTPDAPATMVAALDTEAQNAREVFKLHINALRELSSRERVSGFELEESQARVARDSVRFAKALQPSRGAAVSSAVRFGDEEVRSFTLSPLPGRFVRVEEMRISFQVTSVGCLDAIVRLSHESRVAAGRRLPTARLRWDAPPGDRAISTRLFTTMHMRTSMAGFVQQVVRADGHADEFLLVRLDQTGQSSAGHGPVQRVVQSEALEHN